jgi:hypothetical protein
MPVLTRSQFKKIYNSAIMIGDNVVSRLGSGGLRISYIELEQKLNPTLDIDSLPKITYGSSDKDKKLIRQLIMGFLSLEDVIMQNL